MTDLDRRRLVDELRRDARLPVPDELDRQVRAMLRGADASVRPLLQPTMATGLALAGCVALVFGLAIGFAQSGAAELAPARAVLALVTYLALSAVASAPILLIGRRRLAGAGGSS